MDAFAPLHVDPRFEELLGRLAVPQGTVIADGLWGSCAPILAALAAARLRRPLLLVAAHADEADDFIDDIETVLDAAPDLLPQLEDAPGDQQADDELAGQRLRLTLQLAERRGAEQSSRVIVAPIQALLQPVPAAEALLASSRTLTVGAECDPAALCAWLVDQGFLACDAVETPGDFARRGGIVDIFSPAHSDPVRAEFFGSTIESLRLFDAGTQRSAQPLSEVRIPARQQAKGASAGHAATTSFLALLTPDTILAFHEPGEIQELGRSYWQRLGERAGYVPVDTIFRRASDFAQLYLQRFSSDIAPTVRFAVGSLPHFEPRTGEMRRALAELADTARVHVFCDNGAEAQRFGEWLREAPPPAQRPGAVDVDESAAEPAPKDDSAARKGASPAPAAPSASALSPLSPEIADRPLPLDRIAPVVGVLHRGFLWQGPRGRDPDAVPHAVAFVPHHELFSRVRPQRVLRKVQAARPIDSFFDLNAGDYVVHVAHGISRFRGLEPLERYGRREEHLALEFADSAVVHVPISQIHLVQKYIGSVRGKPKLSKLGGQLWKRTRERVAESVTDLAAELLAIQARRATEAGVAYPADTAWQREFEEAFPYPLTPDQTRATAEIKSDMARPRPMDRLLCGDVGYGKTELATRAAFKVIEFGKQVAVLVPTTVLAEQHFQTFRERLAAFPFSIEVLSRFRSQSEQRKIVERANRGQVDILVGTHRLLSSDVRFADLGLVVIDEEQRFGVEAKERLKRLRSTVDVLTLSATPIPRTLHLAMLGIRDISSLATAPVDRRAVVTQVRMWDDALIREALLRELGRHGQAFFVHNFVKDIQAVANRVRTICPEARVVVGHGQMEGAELEEVMLAFMRRDADVLVSTNIIESGIDIASANTIFINRADRFGLADLHQLRGRVGRSKHRGYCYLLLSPRHPLKDTAARRLKAIEHYSALGAGFQIAMRDLEIRGAGNILGPEQSGNIEAVGYEMYCQLLDEAVRRMKNEPAAPWRPVHLELGVSVSVPRAYIRADKQRMEVYKRLASCRTTDDVATLRSDLADAFGPLPEEVETLLALAEIRALAQDWGIRSIVLQPPDVVFAIEDYNRCEALFSTGPGSPRMPDGRTVHWRLPPRFHEPEQLVPLLIGQLRDARPGATAAPLVP